MSSKNSSNTGIQKGKGFLIMLLRLITVINPHEVTKALLLAFNIFLILAAYYMLKIVRDATVLDEYGANTKNLMSGIQVILLIFVIKAFSALAARVSRDKLVSRVTMFFIMNLGVIYILFVTGALGRSMSLVYYIWVGIFNVMVIAQFWGFTIDLYSEEEGKRLFPIIMFGSNFGGLAGAIASKLLIDPKAVNPMLVYQLIIIAAVMLGFCILLMKYIHRKEITQNAKDPSQIEMKTPDEKIEQTKPLEKEQ